MIDLIDVSKSYGPGLPAVNHANLHIDKGEFVFVVGNSGSGKTTLIKLLMKELDSTSGQIIVSGERLEGMKHRRVAKYRRKLGVVFQDFRLLKDRNVYENVAFAQRVVNRPTRVIRKRVPEVLQEVGLLKKGQIFFGNKSGELSCNGTVRKQIEKGFDIIKTGGKKSKDLDLKPGDICLFKGHTNIYAGKDENGKTYWYDFGRDQTKDKKPGSVFVKSVRKGEINWAVITVILRVKDQDSYGSGKTTNIPSPYGDSFTYMGWSLITSTGSNQYKLRVKTGEHYDANGFGKICDRYVIACTPTFGKIGDEIDFVLANGRVIHGVMGDEKNMSDAGCNKWGHDGGHSVVEFVVNKSMWYHTGKTVTRFHPEWAKSRVVKAVNLGKNHLK